jgi:hypothetical protein
LSHSVQRFDHVEIVVGLLELLAQPLDVAVDGAVVDIDLVVIGRIHQRIPALDHARARRQRLQDQELGDGERHRLVLPRAGMAFRVHPQEPAFEHLRGVGFLRCGRILDRGPAQHRLDPLDQQPLRERLPDEIVGAHLEAEQFVDLLVLRGEEDDRHVGLLAQPAQRLHAVHARHLDVEDRKIRRARLEAVERRGSVRISHDTVALGLECDRDRRQDVAVVIHESDSWHVALLARIRCATSPANKVEAKQTGRSVTTDGKIEAFSTE